MPMGELMTTLRDLKLSKVTYLELLAFDKHIWTEDTYNDAIVNIFTRLNTAGRTLTREEITLAWLKVGWEPDATGARPPASAFRICWRTWLTGASTSRWTAWSTRCLSSGRCAAIRANC